MCGGIVGKIFKEAGRAVGSVTGVLGLTPDIPSAPSLPDPGELQEKAAVKAQGVETKRRRSILTGGRPSTNIAGRQIAQLEQSRKTLLGQ